MTVETNGTAMAVRDEQRDIASIDLTAVERVIVAGDLGKLSPEQRWDYYQAVCRSVGLNPFTQPFAYITLNSKLVLYALKGATDQLRRIYGVSVAPPSLQFTDGLAIVSVIAAERTGRTDSDLGIVTIEGLKGDNRANAIMKAITKAKRRVTLSMCGLGMLDETEIETIPNARPMSLAEAHGVADHVGTEQPKPAGFRYSGIKERYTAAAEYERLTKLATEHEHPRAADIRAKHPKDLTDGELEGSVKTLQRWERSIKPAAPKPLDDTAQHQADVDAELESERQAEAF